MCYSQAEVGVSGIWCRPQPSWLRLRMSQTSPNSQLQREHLGVHEQGKGVLSPQDRESQRHVIGPSNFKPSNFQQVISQASLQSICLLCHPFVPCFLLLPVQVNSKHHHRSTLKPGIEVALCSTVKRRLTPLNV